MNYYFIDVTNTGDKPIEYPLISGLLFRDGHVVEYINDDMNMEKRNLNLVKPSLSNTRSFLNTMTTGSMLAADSPTGTVSANTYNIQN